MQLGFDIPIGVFSYFRINHTGLLIVNKHAKIGAFCDIHQGVNITKTIPKRMYQPLEITYGLVPALSCLGTFILRIIFQLEQMQW
nr:hypothetical protein P5627_18190 [Bacillus safensis]